MQKRLCVELHALFVWLWLKWPYLNLTHSSSSLSKSVEYLNVMSEALRSKLDNMVVFVSKYINNSDHDYNVHVTYETTWMIHLKTW